MKNYRFESTYKWHGKDNKQTGTMTIKEDKTLVGIITDPNSTHPERRIIGMLSHREGEHFILDIFKLSTGSPYAPIHYILEKADENPNEITGLYEGSWAVNKTIVVAGSETKNTANLTLEEIQT